MSLPAAVAVGTGTSVVANVMTDAQKDETDIAHLLGDIRDLLKSNNAYNARERERTPAIIEMTSLYAAGIPTNPNLSAFTPPSPLNIDYMILALRSTVASELTIAITFGTRPIVLPVPWMNNANINNGVQRYDLPYHVGGIPISFASFVPAAPFTGQAILFIVGWYEQNRIGPKRVIGEDV